MHSYNVCDSGVNGRTAGQWSGGQRADTYWVVLTSGLVNIHVNNGINGSLIVNTNQLNELSEHTNNVVVVESDVLLYGLDYGSQLTLTVTERPLSHWP